IGLESQFPFPDFLEKQIRNATHPVAAGTGFRAVIVVDAHISIGAGCARVAEHHELVEGHALRPRNRPRLRARYGALFRSHVHNDELVAEPIHLHEWMVGGGAHGSNFRPYMAAWRPLTRAFEPHFWTAPRLAAITTAGAGPEGSAL